VAESAGRQTPFHPHLHLCPAFSYAPPSPPSFRLPHPSQPLGPPRNATRPVLCTLSACVVVGEPHKNFGQLLLTAACILLAAIGIAWLSTKISSGDMESPPAIVEHFQDLLLWDLSLPYPSGSSQGGEDGFPLQFSLGFWVVSSFDQRHSPNAKTLEKDYLPVEAQTSPAKIAIRQTTVTTGRRNANPWSDVTPDVRLSFPITVSGVASGTMVMVDVMRSQRTLRETHDGVAAGNTRTSSFGPRIR